MTRGNRNSRSFQWLDIVIPIIIFIIGVFAQPMLETQVEPLVSPSNIPLTIFILVSVVFAVNIAVWNNTRWHIASLEEYTHELVKYVGYKVRVLPQVEGYDEVRKQVQMAKSEILKLIYYELDLKNGKPVYGDQILLSPERKSTYAQEKQILQQERGEGAFRYVEIVQIAEGFDLNNIIADDIVYKEHCENLANICLKEPEFASLRVSSIVFPNTLIIIDRSFLYIAFQTKNPETGSYEYPFLGIIIEDPDSKVVRDMVKLHQRLEAQSKLITKIS
jgi:hypothetical protein